MPYAPDLAGAALDGRYELHALIGEGSFGRVYRGRDRRLERTVAIKVIKPWWADDPDWAHRFARETQMLARVSDPGIVQIFDVGHADEGLYYVSELVDGESLASRLERGPLPAWEACEIAEQLSRALAHAHDRGIVHRDVKPANILISAAGDVKVGDFGVARMTEGTSEGPPTIVGTPRYMAPEQARGEATGPATDIYSVGVVLYEMLVGRPPFPGGSSIELALHHLQDPPPPLPAGTPRALAKIALRALAKKPEARYRSGGELADALSAARGEARRAQVHLPGASNGNGHGATDGITRATPRLERTRVAPQHSPRRNVNPSARRRTIAAFGVAGLVLVALVVAAAVVGTPKYTSVPKLHGLTRNAIVKKARRAHLRAVITQRYNSAPAGKVLSQTPSPGTQVADDSVVHVVLSKGPPPVELPGLVGQQASNAKSILSGLGLHPAVTYVAAPGTAPGVVTHESPSPKTYIAHGRTVTLSVAETPQWRTVTSFDGTGPGRSVPFQIRGDQWRIVYSMHYIGTCTWLFWCSGPSASVVRLSNGWAGPRFGLGNGSDETRVFESGPGVYQVGISPGGDDAGWAVQVQDYY
jgi:eukaryotic-like serine/threonine-protein kinase